MKVRRVKQIAAVLLVLCMMACMAGCKKKKMSDEEYLKLAETKASQNKNKVLLRMMADDGSVYDITAYDMVYYLAYSEKDALELQAKQHAYYVSLYGNEYDFWEITDSNGTKVKDGYKENAYASASYAFIFSQQAKNSGMVLEEARRLAAATATEKFLLKFTAEQRAKCGMTEACIRENYERIFLAEQYIEKMTRDFKVDEDAIRATVDREDYRVYETDYLYVAKFDRDEDYKRVDFTPEESARRKAAIDDALERVKGGESMVQVRSSYDDIMGYGTSDFYRTQIDEDPEYNKAAMALKKGECTLFERESSYYIILLVDNEKYSGYEEAVASAIETAQNTGIADYAKTISDRYEVVKTEEWDSITLGSYAIVK